MPKWPKDTTAAKNVFYGDFLKGDWQEHNLARYKPPFLMYYEGKPMLRGILIHERIEEAMDIICKEIWEKCNRNQQAVDKTGASDFGGCFKIRKIAGSNNWSNHSWACAIDLSPASNGFNMKSTLSSIVVEAFKRQGARWGGDYKGRKDPMHFEFVSPT